MLMLMLMFMLILIQSLSQQSTTYSPGGEQPAISTTQRQSTQPQQIRRHRALLVISLVMAISHFTKMKRGADKQLTKDDDMEDEVEQVQTGFRVANESELARREMRGLPRRTSPAVLPAIPPANSTPNPADAPAVSESASNATKKFASFLGPSSTAGAKPLLSSAHTLKTDASGDTDEVALGYYTSLRGLNSSFLSAVTNAIQSDPFIDIADTLEQYKSIASRKPSIPPASFSFPKPATSAPATMPVPPSSFVGFGATSSAKPPTGFNTGHAPPSTPFSFSSSSSSSSSSSTAAAAAAAATATEPSDSQSTSAISFSPFAGAVSSSSPFKPTASKEMETTPSLKPAFSLGAASFTGPTSSAFPFGGSTTLHFSNPPKSSSLFGSEKAATEEKDKEKDKPPHLRPRRSPSPWRPERSSLVTAQ
ncbi:hypothetical protein F5148DRAFT_1379051, partial [Russula earlei]